MDTPNNTPTTPAVPTTPTAPTPATPASTSDKTSRYIAGAALLAAGLAGYVAYNANQEKPVAAISTTDTSERKIEPVATTTASAEPEKAPTPPVTNPPEVIEHTESVKTMTWEELREDILKSATHRYHEVNTRDFAGYENDQGHWITIGIADNKELQTRLIKDPVCDKRCVDLGDKKAAVYADTKCADPDYKPLKDLYGFKAANLDAGGITYTALNGQTAAADADKAVHILGHVVTGKTCTDLARKPNTGTGTVRISDGPTRNEFNNLNVRVGQVEKKVNEAGNTLAGLMDAYNDRETHNLCTGSQNPNCQEEVRSSIRKSLADEAKSRAERNK